MIVLSILHALTGSGRLTARGAGCLVVGFLQGFPQIGFGHVRRDVDAGCTRFVCQFIPGLAVDINASVRYAARARSTDRRAVVGGAPIVLGFPVIAAFFEAVFYGAPCDAVCARFVAVILALRIFERVLVRVLGFLRRTLER